MDQNTTISWGFAWQHCATLPSYWAWIIGAIAFGLASYFIIGKIEDKANKDLTGVKLAFCVGAAFWLFFAFFHDPSNLSQSTTYAMAAQNIWQY